MPARPSSFKMRDMTRAAKAVLAAGLDIARFEVNRDGFTVVPGKPSDLPRTEAANEWDEVLNGTPSAKVR
ncbi:MAG TPA: hypothetical protein VEK34_14155 [Methylocella sp.]|nr:hypothetical protein [Methylocella sp.]